MCDVNVLFKYPLISCVDDDEFRGFITVNRQDVEVMLKRFGDSFTVKLPKNAQYETEINTAISSVKHANVLQCLDCIQATLSSKPHTKIPPKNTDIYRLVLHEFCELSNIYMNLDHCLLSPDLNKITFGTTDHASRKHELIIRVDYTKKDKEIFYVEQQDLPKGCFVKNGASLRAICEKFLHVVRSLQDFWDVMDAFDRNFWILDPEDPKRADVHRRVSLGDNLSVIVTFDPFNISSVPVLKFLGAERLLEKYRARLVENLSKWDKNGDVITEFLKLLEVDSLPKKPQDMMDTDLLYNTGECCICFCLRLDDKLPEIVCPNTSCEEYFHTQCLYQYLLSLNSRKCFNEIRGNCPNCEKTISCPIP